MVPNRKFKLQPSEFAKFATNLAIAKYLSTLNIRMQDIKTKFIAVLLLGLPAGLIVLQGDAGSTLVYSAFIFVLYREGLSGNVLIFGLVLIVLFFLALLFNPLFIIGILTGISSFVVYIYSKEKK